MSGDYEAEYNNRARVPDHPAILAGWVRDAAAYRAEASAAVRTTLGLSYGNSPRQTIDLFHPDPAAGGQPPLALFIHGGYWRTLEPASFSHMASGLNAHGIAVAVAGYDLCPEVTIGDIIAQMRAACVFLWRRFQQPLTLFGHSAGGHLAACMLATEWRAQAPDLPPDFIEAAVSISGLFDLHPLISTSMNADLRLDEAQARAASPIHWPAPSGRVLDLIVGGDESTEFIRQSRDMASAWGGLGAQTRYEEIAGANHFTVLDPLSDPQSMLVRRLVALCGHAEKNRAA